MITTVARTGASLGDDERLDALSECSIAQPTSSWGPVSPAIDEALAVFNDAVLRLHQPLPTTWWTGEADADFMTHNWLARLASSPDLYAAWPRTAPQWQVCIAPDMRLAAYRFLVPGSTELAPWDAEIGFRHPASLLGAEAVDVVTLVDRVQTQLGLPHKHVLEAAGIRRSSYYHWRNNPDSRPRIDSAGRLVELADCATELRGLLGDQTPGWLRAHKGARSELRRGQFDTVLGHAVRDRFPIAVPWPETGTTWAAAVGAADDRPLFLDLEAPRDAEATASRGGRSVRRSSRDGSEPAE